MSKKASRVVSQFAWTAVKEVNDPQFSSPSYDMWEWNVWKLKWVRLSNTACGFGSKDGADSCAKERSDEIQAMLVANGKVPNPL